jgi:nucleoside 2-deoxyribosyltransferase
MKIYLAGDMKSGWQDRFAAMLPARLELIDPRSHGLSDPAAYTAWDLEGVRRADTVVAYMGPHNPSGFGLSIEAGYAHALGKPIIFVDEMTVDWRGRYFDMLRQIAWTVPSLEAAALILRKEAHAQTTKES